MSRMLIASELVGSESKETTTIKNPATGEVVDSVPKGTINDIRRAIDAAQAALKKWSLMAPAKRGAVLLAAGHAVLAEEKELATLLTREQGKPMRESMLEIRRFVHTLEHYGGMAKTMRTSAVMLDTGRHGLVLRKPLGVCGSIVPWNFPVSLMGNKLGPALLAGNTVVVKPAGTTPLTDLRCCEIIDKAIQDAAGPKGVLNVVTGPGSVVGEELLVNPTVRKIGFTGATDTGRRVMQSAASDFKHVTLELGGSDPMIVCDDADIDRAVSAASVGRFFNCGQACLAVKRLYLFDTIADDFMAKLVDKARKIGVGNGLAKGTLMGPLHTKEQRQEVEEQVEDAVKRGAKVILGRRCRLYESRTSTRRSNRRMARYSAWAPRSGPAISIARCTEPRTLKPDTRGSTRRRSSMTNCRSAASSKAVSARNTVTRPSSIIPTRNRWLSQPRPIRRLLEVNSSAGISTGKSRTANFSCQLES
jgi:acyl-CoA reductase-like NAD-dependent aldehyde dehydrogenase